MRSISKKLVLAGVIFSCAQMASGVSTHPHLQQGLSFDKTFSMGNLDQINLFSGALSLSIPIGQRYQVGPVLSYQFMLSYSSNRVWDFDAIGIAGEVVTAATPSAESNAGAGWVFGLGRLLIEGGDLNETEQDIYVSPDGSAHSFYDSRLSEQSGTTKTWEGRGGWKETETSSGFYYTRDGTHLRMQHVTDLGTDFYIVEFPNGVRHFFNSNGLLTSMHDHFGNSVTFSYDSSQNGYGVTDSFGRSHTITAQSLIANGPIQAVTLDAYESMTALYVFDYHEIPSWPRSCRDTQNGPGGTPTPVPMTFLKSVELPDNSSFTLPVGFDPSEDKDAGSEARCAASGFLTELTVPTGGTYTWSYSDWYFNMVASETFITGGGLDRDRVVEFLSRVPGVVERTTSDGGTWTYVQERENPPFPHSVKTTVTTPLQHVSKHWYHTNAALPAVQFYGLPFNPDVMVDGRYLSTRVFNQGGTQVLQTYVRYEGDITTPLDPTDAADSNRRIVSNSRRYPGDGQKYTFRDFSEWDGLGHYRQVVSGGNFEGAGSRTVVTDYNSDNWVPSTEDNWILTTFDSVTTTEGEIAKVEMCFDRKTSP